MPGKVLIDADACPVWRLAAAEAEKRKIPVILITDDSHRLETRCAQVITVSQGADAADYKLISLAKKGDLVITQDYGVASMALGLGAQALNQNGTLYTSENIDRLLFERHIGQKLRRSGRRGGKGAHIPPRTKADDDAFLAAYLSLLEHL